MSKREARQRLAALTFSEKVEILEKLRDRSLELAVVQVSLVSKAGVFGPDQETKRKQVESDVQKYLSAYLKGGAPNASGSVLNALLTAWLQGYGHVRFEINIDGTLRGIDVISMDELSTLIGPGQTPVTFLQGLGQRASVPEQSNSRR